MFHGCARKASAFVEFRNNGDQWRVRSGTGKWSEWQHTDELACDQNSQEGLALIQSRMYHLAHEQRNKES